jgi:hypothetical protein
MFVVEVRNVRRWGLMHFQWCESSQPIFVAAKVDPFVQTKFGRNKLNLGRVENLCILGRLQHRGRSCHSGTRTGAQVAPLRSLILRSGTFSARPDILARKR